MHAPKSVDLFASNVAFCVSLSLDTNVSSLFAAIIAVVGVFRNFCLFLLHRISHLPFPYWSSFTNCEIFIKIPNRPYHYGPFFHSFIPITTDFDWNCNFILCFVFLFFFIFWCFDFRINELMLIYVPAIRI